MRTDFNDNIAYRYFFGVMLIAVIGFAYAPFIMWFWNLVVCKIVSCAARITYMQSYIAYLFFVVLPKIMPIRFNLQNNFGKTEKK
jgi:glycerol-3-phosphate acyltransferase PlsY